MLFLLLFAFFIVLNGKLTMEIALVGLVVCALADLLACKVLGWNREKSRRTLRLLPDILLYVLMLIWQILKANAQVIRIIVSPDLEEMDPVIYRFDCHLENQFARTVLANSITLTPGTYTVKAEDEKLQIHCLGREFVFGDMELCFNIKLAETEAKEAQKRA